MQISEWNELLTRADVVKFAVVRHPLTRFVSVWDDHFCRSCEHPKDPFLEKKIVLDDEAEYQISLPELAQAVVDQGMAFYFPVLFWGAFDASGVFFALTPAGKMTN